MRSGVLECIGIVALSIAVRTGHSSQICMLGCICVSACVYACVGVCTSACIDAVLITGVCIMHTDT